MSKPNRPEHTLRDGSLKATIWRNEGEKGPYFSTTLARTYEDRDGKLQDTNSFSSAELLKVAELARDAYAETRRLSREYSQAMERGREATAPADHAHAEADRQRHHQPRPR